MIHRRKGRKLKRTASHRRATLSSLSVSLIMNKKITTTLAKAKELRRFIEPIINSSKKAYITKADKPEKSLHMMREAGRFLQDRGAVKTLFDEIAPKVLERPGGYTRVLKMGHRLGDAAEMALIELVDYNIEQAEQKPKESSEPEKKPKAGKDKKGTKAAKASKPKKKVETA